MCFLVNCRFKSKFRRGYPDHLQIAWRETRTEHRQGNSNLEPEFDRDCRFDNLGVLTTATVHPFAIRNLTHRPWPGLSCSVVESLESLEYCGVWRYSIKISGTHDRYNTLPVTDHGLVLRD